MLGVVGHEFSRGAQLVIGVDTHQDEHVAVAIDGQGVRIGERRSPATTWGYGGPRAMVPELGRGWRVRG